MLMISMARERAVKQIGLILGIFGLCFTTVEA